MRDREAGFTLIELMVTVAVIAILAAIAIPSFFGETRKAKASSEIQPLFNDIRNRLEQYLQEHGSYPPSPPGGEAALAPAGAPGTTKTTLGTPTGWDLLKLRTSGDDKVGCRYAWVTGKQADAIGAQATLFGFAKPAADWYYLLAKCDMDNSGAGSGTGGGDGFSWYFASSTDPTLLKRNDGD